MLSTKTHFRPQDTYRLKVRGWKNIFYANRKENKAGVVVLISDKIVLKIKITRDKEGHSIMIKGSIQEEDITTVNIYAPNIAASQYIRQTLSQFSSVAQSCLTLCDPMNRSKPSLSVHYQLPEFTQSHVHRVSDAIQPSHPRLSPSSPVPIPPAPKSFPVSQLFV